MRKASRRTRSGKQQPVVDKADVERIVELFLGDSEPIVSDEEFAKLVHQGTLALEGNKTTAAYRRELARQVKRSVEFRLMVRRGARDSN